MQPLNPETWKNFDLDYKPVRLHEEVYDGVNLVLFNLLLEDSEASTTDPLIHSGWSVIKVKSRISKMEDVP